MLLLAAGVRAQTNDTVQFTFREPIPREYSVAKEVLSPAAQLTSASLGEESWTQATLEGTTQTVDLGSRVVLQIDAGQTLQNYLAGRALTLVRAVSADLFILQAKDSFAAIQLASELAAMEGVLASYPMMRRPFKKHDRYGPLPDDPLFPQQWHLENRGPDWKRAGPDLNVRAAWPLTRGENVLVAVADDGFQLDHPELSERADASVSYNFYRSRANGGPASSDANHATCVAGLIAASVDNQVGVAGVAPAARLASWVIFGTSFRGVESFVTDEQLMNMFQSASNRVSVQNHSWGSTSTSFSPIDALSNAGIENAVNRGRHGLGVVLVRAAGNEREELINANDDGYATDPRAIAVAAVRKDGRATSYSSPGACLLVAAPSGDVLDTNGDGQADATDPDAPDVLTTDRTGSDGYNTTSGDEGNYAFFDGTSASSPQVAGVAALILSANPDLGYRDVQQILLQSAHHYDVSDPDLRRNGAGLWVSHNVGYGVPDAGLAVRLAKAWSNHPPLEVVHATNTVRQDIPDDALRVVCAAPDIPVRFTAIRCLPSLGPHADTPTQALPLVDVGMANEEITVDLHGKGALIERGQSLFVEKIERAARAGAAFAIIYNNQGTNQIQALGGTTFVPIPAVSIGLSDGQALRDFISAHPETTGMIRLTPAVYRIPISETLICEHIGVRLKTTHTQRADVRVTLVSPMGTRSVLQSINADTTRGPVDWTYWTAQHFYESSAGEWRLEVSDERNTTLRTFPSGTRAATGSVTYAELILQGVKITDRDADGLDDYWEMKWFGNLDQGPQDDPDHDGFNNAREQAIGMDPTAPAALFGIDLTELAPGYLRLSWPGLDGESYGLESTGLLGSGFQSGPTVPGHFPVTEYVVPAAERGAEFYQVRRQNTGP